MHIISLGWPFTKETIRNIISCLPSARVSLCLILCTECNQHFGCLAFILEKTHRCFFAVPSQGRGCSMHLLQSTPCCPCIYFGDNPLFFVVSNRGAVCCVYPLQSTPGPPCRVSIFNLLSLNCTAYCKEHNRTHKTTF